MAQPGTDRTNSGQFFQVADNVIAGDLPDVSKALRHPDGLLAIGGNLEPETLLSAYRRGIFPWYSEGQPILWWSPDPRCVLEPGEVRISRSLARTLKRNRFKVSFNQAFAEVVRGCSGPRGGDTNTWITNEMAAAYNRLHRLGHAISCECWHEGELAGGLYGVVIGRVFFGESMFSRKADASKVALVRLAEMLDKRRFRLIDCQVHSGHLETLGARSMPRDTFIGILKHYCS